MTEQPIDPDVEAAWARARPISGRDPALYRIAPDVIRSVIRRDRYNVPGEYGWRIEYGRPVALREVTTESAIRALQRDAVGSRGRQARSGAPDQMPR